MPIVTKLFNRWPTLKEIRKFLVFLKMKRHWSLFYVRYIQTTFLSRIHLRLFHPKYNQHYSIGCKMFSSSPRMQTIHCADWCVFNQIQFRTCNILYLIRLIGLDNWPTAILTNQVKNRYLILNVNLWRRLINSYTALLYVFTRFSFSLSQFSVLLVEGHNQYLWDRKNLSSAFC